LESDFADLNFWHRSLLKKEYATMPAGIPCSPIILKGCLRQYIPDENGEEQMILFNQLPEAGHQRLITKRQLSQWAIFLSNMLKPFDRLKR
jgi:hypothetical protein